MEEIKKQTEQLTDFQRVYLFEHLRDQLNLKTPTEMAQKYGKSYGGVTKWFSDRLTTRIGRTVYFVDK
jgi:hypothetical protein